MKYVTHTNKYMLKKSQSIKIQLPTYQVLMNCFESKKYIPPSLDVDLVVDNFHYPLLQFQDFNLNFLCFLHEIFNTSSNPSSFIEVYNYMILNNNLISASSTLAPDSIFIIIPYPPFNYFSLFRFQLSEVLGNNPQNYIDYINDIKLSRKKIIDIFNINFTELKIVRNTSENYLEQFFMRTLAKIDIINRQLKKKKEKILKLNEEFEEKAKVFKNVECSYCMLNEKDILFLPCGHVSVCSECLLKDFKVLPNFPIIDSQIKCDLCRSIVTQTIKFSFGEKID